MQRDVQKLSALPKDRAAAFGAKAKTLAAFARKGFPVPPGVALSTHLGTRFVESVLEPSDRIATILEGPPPDKARLDALVARLESAPIPRDIDEVLRTTFRSLIETVPFGLAVRSSSTVEDEIDASAAGINATVLGVRDEDAFIAAVKRSWASLHSPRAIAYLRLHARDRGAAMGVVVQAMIPSEIAGVAFTVNPLNGDDTEVVIESGFGLGTTVVDGGAQSDVVRVDKRTLAIRDRILGDKREALALDESGLGTVAVDDERRVSASLDDRLAVEVTAFAMRVERELGAPADVEFAIADGAVHLLQARPITAMRRAPGRAKKRRVADRTRFVWSNINVGESLPGVATPFTWSVLSGFSDLGFRRAFGAIGCRVPDDAELVGEFRGRIYLNMSEFMRVLSQVPGFDPRVLVALGGGDFASRIDAPTEREGAASFVARLPVTAARFISESLFVDSKAAAFAEVFEAERSRIGAIDLRLLSAAALDRTLLDVERMLDELGAVMLAVYGSLLASVVLLDGWLRLLAGEGASTLERDLFTGLVAVESAAPGILLGHAIDRLRSDPQAVAYLLGTKPESLSLDAMPLGPTRTALVELLAKYGHRGFREAEIAEPRWREDPRPLLSILRVHAEGGGDEAIAFARHRRIADARFGADKRLAEVVPLPFRPLARALVGRVQRLIGLREKLRSDVVALLGAFRTVVLEVSRRIAAREPDAGRDAGFFLSIDEVHALLDGRLVAASPIVLRRRARFERDRALPDPPSTFVGSPKADDERTAHAEVLRGLAASGGLGEGAVRVLRTSSDVDRFARGDVLVVPSADVGWSPLFLQASAVVTDLGGPLSHAAIVMRELGVPAVVNVVDATRTLRDGERVRVDGDRGEVVRLTEAASS